MYEWGDNRITTICIHLSHKVILGSSEPTYVYVVDVLTDFNSMMWKSHHKRRYREVFLKDDEDISQQHGIYWHLISVRFPTNWFSSRRRQGGGCQRIAGSHARRGHRGHPAERSRLGLWGPPKIGVSKNRRYLLNIVIYIYIAVVNPHSTNITGYISGLYVNLCQAIFWDQNDLCLWLSMTIMVHYFLNLCQPIYVNLTVKHEWP